MLRLNKKTSGDFTYEGGKLIPRTALPRICHRPLVQAIGMERIFFASNPCRLRYCTQDFLIFREDLMGRLRRRCVLPPDHSQLPNQFENRSLEEEPESEEDEDESGEQARIEEEATQQPSVPMEEDTESTDRSEDFIESERCLESTKLELNVKKSDFISEESAMAKHLAKTVIDQGHLCPISLQHRPTIWTLDHTLCFFSCPDVLVIADQVGQYSVSYNQCNILNPGVFGNDSRFSSYIVSSREVVDCHIPRD